MVCVDVAERQQHDGSEQDGGLDRIRTPERQSRAGDGRERDHCDEGCHLCREHARAKRIAGQAPVAVGGVRHNRLDGLGL